METTGKQRWTQWSIPEIVLYNNYVAEGKTYPEIAAALGRSVGSVVAFRFRKKLKRPVPVWKREISTEEEKEILAYFKSHAMCDVLKRFHIGQQVFYSILKKYGLSPRRRGYRAKVYDNPQKRKWFIENYPNLQDSVIAVYLGVSLNTVYCTARRLGLSKSAEYLHSANESRRIKISNYQNSINQIKITEHEMEKLINDIKSQYAAFEANAEKAKNGNKSAGLRARKASLELTQLLKQFRKASLE